MKLLMKLFCILSVLLNLPTWCYSQDNTTPESVFRSYAANLKRVANISFHSVFKDRIEEESDVFTNSLAESWKVDCVGKRLWFKTQRVIERPKTEADKARTSQYNEALLTSNVRQTLSVNADGTPMGGLASYLKISAKYWDNVPLSYLSYPFGYFEDGRECRFIPDMFRTASKRIVPGEGKAASDIALRCETDEFSLTLHVDPAKGWMASRIEIARKDLNRGDARPVYWLYTVERSSKHGDVWLPELYHCKVVTPAGRETLPNGIRKIGRISVNVDSNAKSKAGTNYVEHPKTTLIAEVILSDVDLSPLHDADFQLQTKIPNGTRVSMQDAHHLTFIWQDGKAVPVTAEQLALLQDSRFVGGTGSRSVLLTINIVVLVALILCFIIRRWRKARVRIV